MRENIVESIPEWLNTHFLEKHLQNHYKNDEINVINYNVKVSKAKGENIYRIRLTFGVSLAGEENLHLIVKEASSDADMDVFNTEMIFYEEIVPKINEFLEFLGEPEIFPDVYGVCKTKKIIILGDLLAKDYQILPASRGYNIPEAKVILKKVALFHAICAVLQEKEADIFANFAYGHLSRDVSGFDNIYTGNFQVVTDIISQWPDFVIYAEKLRRLHGKIIERGHHTYDVNPNHFNTLNHDSLCCPNLMVRTDNATDENPFDNVVLIDFQYCCWGSPATDLHYFLNTSIDEAHRPQQFVGLVQFYHAHLVNFLKQLNYKSHIPTWTELHKQYQERRILGFIMSCLVQPFMINSTAEATFDDILLNNAIGLNDRREIYKDEKVQANLRKLILYYDQQGTFL